MRMMATLAAHGQEHVLKFVDELAEAGRRQLLDQLECLDWDRLGGWIRDDVLAPARDEIPDDLAPAPYFPAEAETAAQRERYTHARVAGEELLRQGKVAAFTVAGGQGTRLGYDEPKGVYPISPIKNKSLFQLFAESLWRHGEICARPIPWYIMTSAANDRATRAHFAGHDYFGLEPGNVIFFVQGQMPVFDFNGKLLLAARDRLAMAPDGHGGSLQALHRSGALADMRARGVDYISYFQVDNPLVSTVEPLFLGLHHLEGSQMSSRMLAKRDPFEKLGLLCLSAGRLHVIEYSDLPDELAVQTDATGKLRFLAGSPAIHVLSREFVEELNAGSFSLPFHRAEKKVPHAGDNGKPLEPGEPNAVKLETFVFDALPLARKTLILEAVREREFAPVKNAEGQDSPASCRKLLQEEFARWLELRGVRPPRKGDGSLDCTLEISPRSYVTAEDFARAPLPDKIEPGAEVYIQ